MTATAKPRLQFVSNAGAIMRSYRTRMSGSAVTWPTQRVDRREALAEARRRLA